MHRNLGDMTEKPSESRCSQMSQWCCVGTYPLAEGKTNLIKGHLLKPNHKSYGTMPHCQAAPHNIFPLITLACVAWRSPSSNWEDNVEWSHLYKVHHEDQNTPQTHAYSKDLSHFSISLVAPVVVLAEGAKSYILHLPVSSCSNGIIKSSLNLDICEIITIKYWRQKKTSPIIQFSTEMLIDPFHL